MAGNEQYGLVPTHASFSGAEVAIGVEDFANSTGSENTVSATADKVGDVASKATDLLGQVKSVTDVFSGKSSATTPDEVAPEKQDKKVYLYAAGGLLALLLVIFIVKKAL